MLELLNYLYVENPYADLSEANETYTRLHDKVFMPRDITLTDDGFVLSDGRNVDQVERQTVAAQPEPVSSESIATVGTVLDAFVGTPARTPPTAIRNKVFVVHGHDKRPIEVLRKFLLFLGLHVMPWSEAVSLTGSSQPHTYDTVKAGMEHAAAIIVIFSPDDLARVRDEFSDDGDADRTPRGQARQNVTLEAGMAFAMAPERTIFVKSAPTREISDIDGFNWIKLDGNWDSRADLKNRLERAGAAVEVVNDNLADPLAGPFLVGT